jgi:hypothetical protein
MVTAAFAFDTLADKLSSFYLSPDRIRASLSPAYRAPKLSEPNAKLAAPKKSPTILLATRQSKT